MLQIEEDFQAWEVYKDTKKYRWLFNKLEVALRQGLEAGPAATAPSHAGTFLHRPIYNLYGMGIGASKFEYNESMYSMMINNGIVPPGHFWCEWLDGVHLSVDYERTDGVWKVRSVWQGEHESKDNLTKFKSWKRLDNLAATTAEDINKYHLSLPFLSDKRVDKFNVEMINSTIIEIHLRWGNDPFDDLPVGCDVIPVWNDEEAPEGEWRGNLHDDMMMYSASGNLSDVRRGYVIKRNIDLSSARESSAENKR